MNGYLAFVFRALLLLPLAACSAQAEPQQIDVNPPPTKYRIIEGSPVWDCPNRSDKSIALTFDDGPSSHTDELLRALASRNVPATFFLKTEQLDENDPHYLENRMLVRRIQSAGHEICNHTNSHRALTSLSDEEIRNEMLKAEKLISEETGRRTQCMRPPYSDYDDRVLRILGKLGYKVISWSFDSGDWLHASVEFPKDFDPNSVLATIKDATKSADGPLIHIQHDNEFTAASVALVPQIIDSLRDDGWKFISMSECLGAPIDEPAP